MKNPITAILRSNSPRGFKVIALSLLLIFICALPMMLYSAFGPETGNPMFFAWLFAVGAVLAHIGFLIGILLIMRDLYLDKK